eukprot:CAMPEP_0175982240 /NCGR_PEP_ID=MMETSP0108-20121206/47789_1 /TAXON_ID=195067 ORGANISM="Goniomonas pacifica, Strain CCMP1869" /NCGR_SAMPLE_ID=MMETSP0108 /ASSEMBLY_ACC=CAM_ASM_000204 /LENGTH=37 /DNA_ID= /DNA_START= /DNA_END= /DNA_ORIENTATION=
MVSGAPSIIPMSKRRLKPTRGDDNHSRDSHLSYTSPR